MNRSGETEKGGLETRSKELFENSVEQLDARTRSRLTQARHAALDELQHRRMPARWIWAPAGGLAAAAAISVFVIGPGMGPATPGVPAPEDLEAVAGVENIELLEDVEFYAWLAEQAKSTPDANSG